jgi:tape measure domain-containing protein
MNSAEVLIKFKGDTKEADNAVKQQETNLKDLQKKGEIALAGLTAAADAFAISMLKGGIEYNAQIETYMTRLTTLTGSAEKANDILNQIKQDALATPFEVSSLTQAESLLLSTGLSAQDARKDILALGDAIAASGGGNAELSRMAVNLQQIKNVGKASALDIKQFAYAGIDIYGLLADSMGTTRAEAAQLDVTYDMLSNALQQASQEGGKYYGAMEKQSKTYAGAMSNLKESFSVFKGEISKGLFNALKKIIKPLDNMFTWLSKNKGIVITIVAPLLTFINTIAGLLVIKKISTAFKAFHAVLAANPLMVVIAAIAAVVVAITTLWNHCEAFRNAVKAIIDFIKNLIVGIKDFIISVGKAIWSFIEPVVDFVKNLFLLIVAAVSIGIEAIMNVVKPIVMWIWDNILSPVIDFFKSAFEFIWGIIEPVISKIKSAFNVVKDAIITAFKAVRDTIKNIFHTIGQIIKAPINGIIKGINAVLKKINSLKIPDWVPGIGGKHTNFKMIPTLATGTNYVPEDTLAYIHQGEAVVPKRYNPFVGTEGLTDIIQKQISSLGEMNGLRINNSSSQPIVNVQVNVKQDPLGRLVQDIKTFSGGAKNDYNYGKSGG